jgi:ABC-type branched-subunit amino acid transport system ATPase component
MTILEELQKTAEELTEKRTKLLLAENELKKLLHFNKKYMRLVQGQIEMVREYDILDSSPKKQKEIVLVNTNESL